MRLNLDHLADALDTLTYETQVYVNRQTGEIVTVLTSDLISVEDGAGDEELEWGDETLPTLRGIVETDEWAPMPEKFDIHEWQIMSDFANEQPGERGEHLAVTIRGRGAFRMFKDAIYRLGVADDWFAYKRNRLRQIAAEALSAAGVEYE